MTPRFPFSSATLSLPLAALILLSPSATTTAAAGPGNCNAYSHNVTTRFAFAFTFPSTVHTGCTDGVPSGDATNCSAVTDAAHIEENHFSATWPSQAARMMDAVGGCIFMCTSGDCRVGNDGLPVELLQFGVE